MSDSTQKNIKLTVWALVAVMVVFIVGVTHKILSPRIMSKHELSANGAIVFDKPRIIPEFNLIDQQGQAFTKEQLKGQWTLVFFGFTTCPDICPTTLASLSKVYGKLNDDIRDKTQIVLLSVDPARDTPEKLEEYVGFFNKNFVGVTGDFFEVKSLADKLNVAFNKVVTGDDYTIDHSAHLVLINPYGDYHGIFKPPFELARLKVTYQSIVSSFRH